MRNIVLFGVALLIVGVVVVACAIHRHRGSEMATSLNIKLPAGWAEFDNPDGPPTYCRELGDTPGPLQISWAEYKGGALPNPSANDLKRMAKEFGECHDFGELVESSSGSCEFGRMGSAVFGSIEHPRIQIWHLSNGRDFIMVTHICPSAPDPVEVREAQEIVRTITLGKKSRWKFW
jgi:hypothetical protein